MAAFAVTRESKNLLYLHFYLDPRLEGRAVNVEKLVTYYLHRGNSHKNRLCCWAMENERGETWSEKLSSSLNTCHIINLLLFGIFIPDSASHQSRSLSLFNFSRNIWIIYVRVNKVAFIFFHPHTPDVYVAVCLSRIDATANVKSAVSCCGRIRTSMSQIPTEKYNPMTFFDVTFAFVIFGYL